MPDRPIVIATRGSALALAQANQIFDQCRQAFPRLRFELKILKTTGDTLQRGAPAKRDQPLPKGLFTKELEVALLKHQADLAVHSLKDLPTEVPPGLKLGAVGKRADVRDVLVYRSEHWLAERAARPAEDWSPGQAAQRGFAPKLGLDALPHQAVIATGSPRRKAQLLARRQDLHVVDIRGNVTTRLNKLAERAEFDALILAAAGLERLHFEITPDGQLTGDAVPDGLLATPLSLEVMLPCVGQGAIGIEIREHDERVARLCQQLNHYDTHQCVLAERAFLHAMGGGCQSPVAAYAEVRGERLRLRAVSFRSEPARRAEAEGDVREPVRLGEQVAALLGTA
jgi:hydroxymethylbilane synthase